MARPEKNNNVASPVLCVFPVHLPEQRKYKKQPHIRQGMHGCFAKENEPRDSFYFFDSVAGPDIPALLQVCRHGSL